MHGRTIAVELREVEVESQLKGSFCLAHDPQGCDGMCRGNASSCTDVQMLANWSKSTLDLSCLKERRLQGVGGEVDRGRAEEKHEKELGNRGLIRCGLLFSKGPALSTAANTATVKYLPFESHGMLDVSRLQRCERGREEE